MRVSPSPCPPVFVAMLLWFVCSSAIATPLLATGETTESSPAPVWAQPTPEQLLRSDPAVDPRSDEFILGTSASLQGALPQPAQWDLRTDPSERGARMTGQGVVEQLRHLVNVESDAVAASATGRSDNRGARNPAAVAAFDVGEAADQWLRETVQTLVDATLRLDVNERGRTTFSVLGLGDFSLSVSPDRSQIALSEGDDALFTVDRARPANAGDRGPQAPFGPDRGARDGAGQPAIAQMLELASEVATHPVSVLVYCIVIAYLILWSVLSRQRDKVRARARKRAAIPPTAVARERTGSRRRSRRVRRTRKTVRSGA